MTNTPDVRSTPSSNTTAGSLQITIRNTRNRAEYKRRLAKATRQQAQVMVPTNLSTARRLYIRATWMETFATNLDSLANQLEHERATLFRTQSTHPGAQPHQHPAAQPIQTANPAP